MQEISAAQLAICDRGMTFEGIVSSRSSVFESSNANLLPTDWYVVLFVEFVSFFEVVDRLFVPDRRKSSNTDAQGLATAKLILGYPCLIGPHRDTKDRSLER